MARGTLTAVLVLAGVPLLGGIQAQQRSVFRSGVDLVTVDATVLDSRGNPVEGLGPQSFDVRVDGRPRRVLWAEFVGHKTPASDPAAMSAPAPTHYSTNEHVDAGRLILIAVDQMHIRRVEGLAALRGAANFIDALSPVDRVAAAPLTHMGAIEFTNQHASVKRYLQTLAGTASQFQGQFNLGLTEALAIAEGNRTWLDRVVLRECGERLGRLEDPRRAAEAEGMRDPCPMQVEQQGRATAQEARTNARQSLNSLMNLIGRLAEIDGPKTLVLVSEGLVAEPQLVDLTSLGAAAQAARVSIYVLQLETPIFDASESTLSPTLEADLQARSDGLARLAGSARGALFRLVGADPHPFRRILTELSGYYLIAFEAERSDRDGRTHRVDVSTRVQDVTVRARPAFRIPETQMADASEEKLVRLLRRSRIATELPLRVAEYRFREPGRDAVTMIVAGELEGTAAAREAKVGFVIIDDRGVVAASGSAETVGGRFSFPAVVPPGRYLLKAGAVDEGGRQGSIERRVESYLSGTGSVRVSDLMLAEPAKDAGRPLRPAVSTPLSDRVVAYLEMYGPDSWQAPKDSVTIDVLRDGRAAPLATAPAALTAAGPGRWVARAVVSVGALPPGAYVAAARVAVPDGPAARLERPFVVK